MTTAPLPSNLLMGISSSLWGTGAPCSSRLLPLAMVTLRNPAIRSADHPDTRLDLAGVRPDPDFPPGPAPPDGSTRGPGFFAVPALTGATPKNPAILARSFRGPVEEAVIRGHIAVVDRAGRLVAWAGDPTAVTTLRSSSKPFQAASFVESGTAQALELGDDSVAIAAASHRGEPVHVAAARRILKAARLSEGLLRCGIHLPGDPTAAEELLRRGERATAIHNNCSGKHAAMLAVCAHQHWPLESYLDRHHPLQGEIAARLARHAGLDPRELAFGIDGCGLPTFGLRICDFAVALAHAASSDEAVAHCLRAMARHPFLVGGTGALDTLVMESQSGQLVVKSGAAAVLGAVAIDGGLALVIKLESGAPTGMAQVAARAMEIVGLLRPPLASGLEQYLREPVRNWAGQPVGTVVADFTLES